MITEEEFHSQYARLSAGKPMPPLPLILPEMGVTTGVVRVIDKLAWEMTYGVAEGYIPALIDPERVDPGLRIVAFMDLLRNITWAGTAPPDKIKAPIESDVKHKLYTFAQLLGFEPEDIARFASTHSHFNDDDIFRLLLGLNKPNNAVNNAGAICAAGLAFMLLTEDRTALRDLFNKLVFDPNPETVNIDAEFKRFVETYFEGEKGFLTLLRKMSGNPNLTIDKEVFVSEFLTSFNNKALSDRVGAIGTFDSHFQIILGYMCYTAACSIVTSAEDLLNMNIIYAAGGMDLKARLADYSAGQPFFDPDYCILDPNIPVFSVNALNSAGMYEGQPFINLVVSGMRATSMKSGVGGFVINILPGVGVVVTFHPWTKRDGNSTYGVNAHPGGNEVTAEPSIIPVRLDSPALFKRLMNERNADIPRTIERTLELMEMGAAPQMAHVPKDMRDEAKDKRIITPAEYREMGRWGISALRRQGLYRRARAGIISGPVDGKKVTPRNENKIARARAAA